VHLVQQSNSKNLVHIDTTYDEATQATYTAVLVFTAVSLNQQL